MSAFVAAAVRHELDRRRLHAFVEELVSELGPSDEAEVVRYSELFAASAAVVMTSGAATAGICDDPVAQPAAFLQHPQRVHEIAFGTEAVLVVDCHVHAERWKETTVRSDN